MGLRPIVADLTQPESLRDLPAAEVVLFAVGFDRKHAASQSIHQVYVDGLRIVLEKVAPANPLCLYVSSTGVYGHGTGEWVDEDSPCQPIREGGRACLAAEHLLAAHALGQKSLIFRLAGIYGPGRIPLRQPLLAGEPIAVPVDGFLNLIHVDDAASIICQAESHSHPPRTYLVSDGHPVIRGEYYRHLAELLGAPPPRFETSSLESAAAQRAASDKRINNGRLLREVAPKFQFPSYREGLAAIVAAEQSSL
jgi:nucleoside-diphosphate-sugar epimerase